MCQWFSFVFRLRRIVVVGACATVAAACAAGKIFPSDAEEKIGFEKLVVTIDTDTWRALGPPGRTTMVTAQEQKKFALKLH